MCLLRDMFVLTLNYLTLSSETLRMLSVRYTVESNIV